jgi:hypothetical protein
LRAQRLEEEAAALVLEKQKQLLDTSAQEVAQHWETTVNTLTHQLAQARVDLLVGFLPFALESLSFGSQHGSPTRKNKLTRTLPPKLPLNGNSSLQPNAMPPRWQGVLKLLPWKRGCAKRPMLQPVSA